jgi:hypothetical protein
MAPIPPSWLIGPTVHELTHKLVDLPDIAAAVSGGALLHAALSHAIDIKKAEGPQNGGPKKKIKFLERKFSECIDSEYISKLSKLSGACSGIKTDLEIINNIRNEFAHNPLATFASKFVVVEAAKPEAIEDHCKALTSPAKYEQILVALAQTKPDAKVLPNGKGGGIHIMDDYGGAVAVFNFDIERLDEPKYRYVVAGCLLRMLFIVDSIIAKPKWLQSAGITTGE